MARSLILLVLAVWLCLAGSVFADDESDMQSEPAVEDRTPAGPFLQPSADALVVCDPSYLGFRYLEVRGVGFDAWATHRLVGYVVDARGVPQIQWSSIWVSPQGQLILAVNLCADRFRNRPALAAGDYTLSVAAGAGPPIAATTFSIAPPPQAAPSED
jgi:hypothetical protein